MVFGTKFPWKRLPAKPRKQHFKFDPFADDEGSISPRIERMLDFLELDDPPTPEKNFELAPAQPNGVEIQHPRPVRAVALKDALHHFEEIAQSCDAPCNGGSSSCPSTPETDPEEYGIRLVTKPRERKSGCYTPLPFEKDEVLPDPIQSRQQESISPSVGRQLMNDGRQLIRRLPSFMERSLAKARAIGNICFYPPTPPAPKADSPRPSEGRACLSPGTLDHFSGHVRQGPPPRPTFVLQRSPRRGATPVASPSPSPRVPTRDMDDRCNDKGGRNVISAVDEGEQKEAEAVVDDELEYVSDFSEDKDEDADGCEQKIVFNFDNDGSYYTDSDLSIYDDEDGYNADIEDSDEPESPCAGPHPESLLSPISSAGLLTSSTSTSSLPSTLSMDSEPSQWFGPILSFPLNDTKLLDVWDTSLCDEIVAFINGDD